MKAFIGRLLLVAIFLLSGIHKLDKTTHKETGPYILASFKQANVPSDIIAVVKEHQSNLIFLAGAAEVIGSLLILFGSYRLGSLILIGFLAVTTVTMHAFWAYTDPKENLHQMTHFMKNVSILGALLILHGSSSHSSKTSASSTSSKKNQ